MIRKLILMLVALFALGTAQAKSSLYKLKVADADGKEVSLKQYKGQVLLIVNTATQCGFTPQYEQLEQFYERYRNQGFAVLDFPCNQFGRQAPGSNEEIATFCTTHFNTQFPRFDKIEVNGEQAASLYVYLKKVAPFKGFGFGAMADRMHQMMMRHDAHYAEKPDIKWNFTKFLVDRKGRVVKRFEPTDDMKAVEEAIVSLLKR